MPTPPPIFEYVTQVAETQVHYIEAGHGDLLLLIHGSLCDFRYWRWQIPEFSNHFRVLVPSLPGCWPDAVGSAFISGTDPQIMRETALADSRYSIERHVRAVVELCEQADTETGIHLVGHSRGAQVALEAALAMPGRIKRLVLADPGFPFSDEPITEPIHAPIARSLGQAPLDEVIGAFVDAVNGANTWRRTVSWFKDMVRANAWTLLPQLNDIHRSIDLNTLAEALTCPVLLVGGEYSPPRYGSRIKALMQALPQSRHLLVPRAAHGMNLANARYFNDEVLAFLRDEKLSG